jgi:hypothetical protein
MRQLFLPPEPPAFEGNVRQKGLSAIDEMVGRPPRRPHPGPVRKRVADREEDIPSDKFPPYWRDALDDLLMQCHRLCAFLGLYLEHATGNPSVDHMLPKSKRWDQVYEWPNYRLCAASMNARKNDMTGLIDPVDCRPGWFALEMVGFQIIRGAEAPGGRDAEITSTLELLNHPECCQAREAYFNEYHAAHISLDYLSRRAPFIATELRRQRRLRPEDLRP